MYFVVSSSDLVFFLISGFPYFYPGHELIISINAYASSLKTLGGVFKTKSQASVGGSVSGHKEGEGESAINPRTEPVLGNLDAEVATTDIPDSPPRRVQKKNKTIGKKPPRPKNATVDDEMEDVEEHEGGIPEREVGPDRVGNYSITKVAKMMSGFPSKSDWAEMERSGLNKVMQKCVEHWGQVSLFT